MPPRQKITKEMILEKGFELARKRGIETVNSRNIARELNCSTQPIFSQFKTMEDLRKGVFDFACNKFVGEVLKNSNDENFLGLTTKWYLNLLRNEQNLYKMLYFSSGFSESPLIELFLNYESNKQIILKLQKDYLLSREQCLDILLRSFVVLHGIGSLITFNKFEISDDEIVSIVRRTVIDMAKGYGNMNKG